MLEEKIIKLREKLDKSIQDGVEYEKIYEMSVELDKLITKYYEIKNGVFERTVWIHSPYFLKNIFTK